MLTRYIVDPSGGQSNSDLDGIEQFSVARRAVMLLI